MGGWDQKASQGEWSAGGGGRVEWPQLAQDRHRYQAWEYDDEMSGYGVTQLAIILPHC